MTSLILGIDTQTGEQVKIAQFFTRGGLYVIGSIGTGKSTLLENLILQDIEQGIGICLLDPAGDLTIDVLARLPGRESDVILLDIGDDKNVFGLNILECSNPQDPKAVQKVVDQVIGIFEKFPDVSTTPLFAHYMRNSIATLVVNPGYTIAEIPLLFYDKMFRDKMLLNVTDTSVKRFWQQYETMPKLDQSRETASALNKFDNYVRPIIFPIIGQSESTINFRQIMDERKILLIKFSPQLSNATLLIVSVIIDQIVNAAYSRSDVPLAKRKQFNVYADEFDYFAIEDFARLFTETRQFGIATRLAHQTRVRMSEQSRSASLQAANVVVFHVSPPDAEEVANFFNHTPATAGQDEYNHVQHEIALILRNLPALTAKVKIEGIIERTIKILPPRKGIGRTALLERIKAIQIKNNREGYTRPYTEVEKEIRERQKAYLEQDKIPAFHSSYNWRLEHPDDSVLIDDSLWSGGEKQQHPEKSVAILEKSEVLQAIVRIRIHEDPLTTYNLVTILSALAGLYTKCWLIAQRRLADLVEYTQTGNSRFTEEAPLVIAKVTYNSPFSMDWKVDLSAPSVAEAFVTAIDGITQRKERLKKAEIETKAKQQKLEEDIQKADQENKLALLEQEKRALDLERERLEVLEKRLEVQKKEIEYAIELAGKMGDILHSSAADDTRVMLVQSLLSNILQVNNGKGLELILPKPLFQESKTEDSQ